MTRPTAPTAPAAPADGPTGLDAVVRVDLPARPAAGPREPGGAGLRLDVRLRVPRGSVCAVLGPNGAGKSTALRALAGLQPLSDGRVVLDGRTLEDPASGIVVAPHQRGAGVVFADGLLFPHLSVVDNVAFALRAGGLARGPARERARRLLDRLGVGDLAPAAPARLSGGQAQRVAIARALAARPSLLLLDEPLAALDAATRSSVRTLLREVVAGDGSPGPATVLVTHDPLDALVLADHLVVLERGVVVQSGSPADVARAPRTEYVASLVGLNLLRGHAGGPPAAPPRPGAAAGRSTTVELVGGGSLVAAAAPAPDGSDPAAPPAHGAVTVSFAPSAVSLHRDRPAGSARNVWRGVVAGLERRGDVVRVRLDADGTETGVLADVTAAAVAELGIREGTRLWASVKATEVRAYRA